MTSPTVRLGPVGPEELVEFLNTIDVATGADVLATSARANRWLRAHHLAAPEDRLDDRELLRARRARELLRGLAAVTAAGRPSRDDLELLDRAARDVRYGIRFGPGGTPRLEVLARGADTVMARLLLGLLGAWLDRTWIRIKICRNPECRRVFLDTSRNRSRSWCDMATCGNQAKARAFRQRQAR